MEGLRSASSFSSPGLQTTPALPSRDGQCDTSAADFQGRHTAASEQASDCTLAAENWHKFTYRVREEGQLDLAAAQVACKHYLWEHQREGIPKEEDRSKADPQKQLGYHVKFHHDLWNFIHLPCKRKVFFGTNQWEADVSAELCLSSLSLSVWGTELRHCTLLLYPCCHSALQWEQWQQAGRAGSAGSTLKMFRQEATLTYCWTPVKTLSHKAGGLDTVGITVQGEDSSLINQFKPVTQTLAVVDAKRQIPPEVTQPSTFRQSHEDDVSHPQEVSFLSYQLLNEARARAKASWGTLD